MHISTTLTALLVTFAGNAAACACTNVSNEGLYCGYCTAVTNYGNGGIFNVYWCNKSGGCKDLGYSKTRCEKDPKIYCDGRDKWKRDENSEAEEDVVEVMFKA